MAMMKHPLTGVEYRRREDGSIDVTGADGIGGVFDRDGQWLSGARRYADAALCLWVAAAPEYNSTNSSSSARAPAVTRSAHAN